MTRFSRSGALGLAIVLVLGITGHARAEILESVLPFTGLDNVRVRATLTPGAPAGEVTLSGKIVLASGDGKPLWEGALGKAKSTGKAPAEVETTIKGLKPELWTPASPTLYNLIVEARHTGKVVESKTIRFGFRTMEVKNASLQLNGKPIFLRGIAINPPGREVPKSVSTTRKFAEDYVRFMRAHNVNIIRMSDESDVWFDVCDELGMLIYQGTYGSPAGERDKKVKEAKNAVPTIDSAIAIYRKMFSNYVRHPSVVIYVLSNEQPYAGKIGDAWHEFLTKIHGVLKNEYTVPFIGNAGYGQGREGDINDVHRYWGWYYNSHLTYYNLRDPLLFGDPKKTKNQPLTFSECVGAFTGPSGAFNQIFRKQLGASLNWTGHAEDQIGEAQSYQAYIFKHAAESFRTMRATNPRLSGLMPFTIIFRNWNGVQSFDQMGHNANADQMTISYNPVLLSLEQWTPNVYAGTTVKAFAHVVNDAEDFKDLPAGRIEYELKAADGKAAVTGGIDTPGVKYYGTQRQPLEIKLPDTLASGTYTLAAKLMAGGKELAHNSVELFISAPVKPAATIPTTISLYDPSGKTAAAFKKLGIPFKLTKADDTGETGPLVIGESVWDGSLDSAAPALKKAVSEGRRILVLSQLRTKFKADWLPVTIEFPKTSNNDPTYEKRERPMADGMHINPERPWHPALAGIERAQLKWWSDYTGWDETKPGFPAIYPVTAGFKLTKVEDLAKVAVIANYDRGLETIAIAEMFDGKGSVLMTGFNLVPRSGLDPVADRVLRNLVSHLIAAEGHELHPLVEKPIVWGNYPTERGVVVEPIGGLVVNCRWQQPPTAPNAKPLPDNEGAWNTRPGDGFVPFGRRVFGPWGYTNATGIRELNDKGAVASGPVPADSADAGAVNDRDDVDNELQKKSKASPTGVGQFWARVPAGRKTVVTKVENPTKSAGKIEVSAGGKAGTIDVAAGQTVNVTCEIPDGMTDVNVKFKADKSLVLLQTTFE